MQWNFLLYSGSNHSVYSLTECMPHDSCNFLMVEIESFWFTYLLIFINSCFLFFVMFRDVTNCFLNVMTTTVAVGVMSVIICGQILVSLHTAWKLKVRHLLQLVLLSRVVIANKP